MFTDLFSALDMFSFMWVPCLLFVLGFVYPRLYPLKSSDAFLINVSVMWNRLKSPRLHGLSGFLYSLFLFILLNNFLGLTPFTMSLTSSLWINSSMAFLIWMCLLSSGWVYSPIKSAGHLCPSGAPATLIPFLVLIETISILIRPLTLTVRLVANISAGHIVMGLLATTLSAMSFFGSSSLLMVAMVLYMLFEFFVSLIQAYIFSLLLSLYAEEHPSSISKNITLSFQDNITKNSMEA